ncbi:hypothetical protein ABT072_16905 [Streptomyces sp. NPDC002589]|uniref:hypothetical protein n=1 Tax=Streptomyces sp. NPDC002589 TaxID=3154420 RepID=UPI003332839B
MLADPGRHAGGGQRAVHGGAGEVLGASEAILFVDDDALEGDPERDRTAASGMYDRAGFTEVDRLHSFTRRP